MVADQVERGVCDGREPAASAGASMAAGPIQRSIPADYCGIGVRAQRQPAVRTAFFLPSRPSRSLPSARSADAGPQDFGIGVGAGWG
jgi:hypothetical protein